MSCSRARLEPAAPTKHSTTGLPSYQCVGKALASMYDSPKPSLIAYTNFRPLALLDMSAWMSFRGICAHAIRTEISQAGPGYRVKPVLRSHSKIDKTKVLKKMVA